MECAHGAAAPGTREPGAGDVGSASASGSSALSSAATTPVPPDDDSAAALQGPQALPLRAGPWPHSAPRGVLGHAVERTPRDASPPGASCVWPRSAWLDDSAGSSGEHMHGCRASETPYVSASLVQWLPSMTKHGMPPQLCAPSARLLDQLHQTLAASGGQRLVEQAPASGGDRALSPRTGLAGGRGACRQGRARQPAQNHRGWHSDASFGAMSESEFWGESPRSAPAPAVNESSFKRCGGAAQQRAESARNLALSPLRTEPIAAGSATVEEPHSPTPNLSVLSPASPLSPQSPETDVGGGGHALDVSPCARLERLEVRANGLMGKSSSSLKASKTDLMSQVLWLTEEKKGLQKALELEKRQTAKLRSAQRSRHQRQYVNLWLKCLRGSALRIFWAWHDSVLNKEMSAGAHAPEESTARLEPWTCTRLCELATQDIDSGAQESENGRGMSENGVGRHMGVMTQRRLPVSHISARQPDLHTIDESPHQGPVGKEQWDDIEVLVSSAPPTPKMQHARVQGNVSGFGGLHGPASKSPEDQACVERLQQTNKKLRACAHLLQAENLQLKQENAILRRERNSLAPQDTSGGALEAYSCHTVAEPALQRRAVPSPSHVHLCPSSPQPPSARRLFFEAESGRSAADGRTDGQGEEADILKSGVKVTKLGEPLSNDKLRASYVSLVSEDCSRESFDDTDTWTSCGAHGTRASAASLSPPSVDLPDSLSVLGANTSYTGGGLDGLHICEEER